MENFYDIITTMMPWLAYGIVFLFGYSFFNKYRNKIIDEANLFFIIALGFILSQLFREKIGTNQFSFPHLLISFACGVLAILLKNNVIDKGYKILYKLGRKRTSNRNIWYDIIDNEKNGTYIRCYNYKLQYAIEGCVLLVSEDIDGPTLVITRYIRYDLKEKTANFEQTDNFKMQCVIKVSTFDEIHVFYQDGSSKITIIPDIYGNKH